MKLKVKILKWNTGLPVAMLDKETAKEIEVYPMDRISIKTTKQSLSTIIDISSGIIKKGELAVSTEIQNRLNLKQNQIVEIFPEPPPKSLDLIKKKLLKKQLNKDEIKLIVDDIANNALSESEIALFVSSMYKSGMNMKETIYLTEAMYKTGNILEVKGKYVVDKHSIGGIPGNRTTPLVVSICAAAGLTFPKTSSRAITSAAGTADVIETIAKVEFNKKELIKILRKTNAFMIWGGSLGLVPVDDRIIQIEKILKMDPEAQLLASIIAKKLSVNSEYILIDIPYGKNAKVNKSKALDLKKKFETIGKYFNKKIKVVLTNGNEPIGNGIGPVLELNDILSVLKGNHFPKDLENKAIFLSSHLLEMTGKAKSGEGQNLARDIIDSGKALKKFNEIIKAQGGNLKNLRLAKFKKDILSNKTGKIIEINNKKINSLGRFTGCPSSKPSGIYLHHHVNDYVNKGDKLITIYSDSKLRLNNSVKFYFENNPILIK